MIPKCILMGTVTVRIKERGGLLFRIYIDICNATPRTHMAELHGNGNMCVLLRSPSERIAWPLFLSETYRTA